VNEQGHYRSFRRRVFAVSHLHLLTNQNNQETEHVQNTNQCNPQNSPYKQQYKTLKKPRLRERTDRAWFSRLLCHPIRKRSGSLFLQPWSPHGATKHRQLNNLLTLLSTLKQTTRGYWLENKNSAIDKKSCNTKSDINYSLFLFTN